MKKSDADFMEKLLITFKSEAEEHLKQISAGLIALEKKLPAQEHTGTLEKVFREAHSLKGAARAVNQDDIQDFCQTLENVFAAWKKGEISVFPGFFDTLHAAFDLIARILEAPNKETRAERGKEIPMQTEKVLALLKRPTSPAVSDVNPVPSSNKVTVEETSGDRKIEKCNSYTPFGSGTKTVHVSVSKLNNLIQEVEEMLNLKLSARKQAASLKDIQERFENWKKIRKKFDLSGHTLPRENSDSVCSKKSIDYINRERASFKSFQEGINQVVKSAAQEFRLIESMVDTLLEDTKKILMQPFSTVLESFPRMVRDLSHSLGKQVILECHGEEIEVDKRILEELKDPLIHLIRNSVDHGIETPEEREKKNKPPEGKIKISISQLTGNQIGLTLSDDGRGMDIQKIKAEAIKKGVITSEEAEDPDEKEVLKLLYYTGISTKEIVTDLSGRGLGISIVVEKVEKLGGRLTIENNADAGATFTIILPTTLATFRGVRIEVYGRQFIIPTQNVVRVAEGHRSAVKNVENKNVYAIENKILPLVHLGNLLGIPNSPTGPDNPEPSSRFPLIIIRAVEKTVALEVDKVFEEKDVLVKGLGKLLLHVKNIVAATITDRGTVIPILNPHDLVTHAMKDYKRKMPSGTPESTKQTILLCEDSITSRMLLLNILECSGYDVKAAVDGEEGLAVFEQEKIDLVLSDVEMPGLDGFGLTEKIRATEKGRHVPVILCTSRESQEDKERGIKVGANAYLEKSSFTQSNLLDVIHKLI